MKITEDVLYFRFHFEKYGFDKQEIRHFYRRWMCSKTSAMSRRLAWQLTPEQFRFIIHFPCHYCGDEGRERGLDRKNSKAGYHIENVVPCCRSCNATKNFRLSMEQMEELMKERNKNKAPKIPINIA